MYNGQFTQCLEVIVKAKDHDSCLEHSTFIKKQCDAWALLDVRYDESKSARKGPVLERTFMIYQTGYAGNILIFREALRTICKHFEYYDLDTEVRFTVRATEPVNDLRNQ